MATDNKTIARRFVEDMMNGQHLERIDEFVAADAVHHERFDVHNYRDALRNVFRDSRHEWLFTVEDVIAEGDKVMVRCMASYRVWADLNNLGVSYVPGTRAFVEHAHIFRIRDGMIVEHWPVRDIYEAVLQFHDPARSARAEARPVIPG